MTEREEYVDGGYVEDGTDPCLCPRCPCTDPAVVMVGRRAMCGCCAADCPDVHMNDRAWIIGLIRIEAEASEPEAAAATEYWRREREARERAKK